MKKNFVRLLGIYALSIAIISCGQKKTSEDVAGQPYWSVLSETSNQDTIELVIERFVDEYKVDKESYDHQNDLDRYGECAYTFLLTSEALLSWVYSINSVDLDEVRPVCGKVLAEIYFSDKEKYTLRGRMHVLGWLLEYDNNVSDLSSEISQLVQDYCEYVVSVNDVDSLPISINGFYNIERNISNDDVALVNSAHRHAMDLVNRALMEKAKQSNDLEEIVSLQKLQYKSEFYDEVSEAAAARLDVLNSRIQKDPNWSSFKNLSYYIQYYEMEENDHVYYTALVRKASTYEECQTALSLIPGRKHPAIYDAAMKKAQNILGIAQCN